MNSSTRFAPARLRKAILDMAYAGSTVHIGCAFSIVEILAVLHRTHLRYPHNDPVGASRDFLVLSKGHGVMAQYACMYERGWLRDEQLSRYFADGTHLKGLSDSRVTGLEVTSGSLGHGFSVGVGLALGVRRRGTDQKVFAVVGDGELNEGAIWEGALFASTHKLDNFMVIVDENGQQAMGRTGEILELGDLVQKWKCFGFDALSVDGHHEAGLDASIRQLWSNQSGRPKALVARTVKGKGVSFMEDNNAWHYTRLDPESYRRALDEVGAG